MMQKCYVCMSNDVKLSEIFKYDPDTGLSVDFKYLCPEHKVIIREQWEKTKIQNPMITLNDEIRVLAKSVDDWSEFSILREFINRLS
jgi:hypothetical protein